MTSLESGSVSNGAWGIFVWTVAQFCFGFRAYLDRLGFGAMGNGFQGTKLRSLSKSSPRCFCRDHGTILIRFGHTVVYPHAVSYGWQIGIDWGKTKTFPFGLVSPSNRPLYIHIERKEERRSTHRFIHTPWVMSVARRLGLG